MWKHGSETCTQTGISTTNYQKQLTFQNMLLCINAHVLQKAISQ